MIDCSSDGCSSDLAGIQLWQYAATLLFQWVPATNARTTAVLMQPSRNHRQRCVNPVGSSPRVTVEEAAPTLDPTLSRVAEPSHVPPAPRLPRLPRAARGVRLHQLPGRPGGGHRLPARRDRKSVASDTGG